MKHSIFSLLAACTLACVMFTSATYDHKVEDKKSNQEQEAAVKKVEKQAAVFAEKLNTALKDGNELKFKDIKEMAVEAKGEKLTMKEKIGLKVFGKKIQNLSKANDVQQANGEKSQVVALVLGLLLGGLGIHRFYLGYTWQGVVQLLTAGGCGIWALIDIIRIATGDLGPKDGAYDKTL